MKVNSIKRLKVLFLCSWYPNKDNLTVGNFIQKHAEAANIYNDVIVLAIVASKNTQTIEIVETSTNGLKEIVVYYPKKDSFFTIGNKISGLLSHIKAFRLGYKRVQERLGKPDILHLNVTYPMGIWAKWLKRKEGIPYVITEHSNGFHLNGDHAYSKTILNLSKSVFADASMILPVSEDLKRNLEQLAPKAKFRIISNVVNETIFTLVQKPQTKTKKFIHISTGYDPQKNLSGIITVLHAIYKIRQDFQLTIISDGDVDYAKQLVNDYNLTEKIFFQGTKSTEEVANFMTQSDALVLFSNYENFPCVIAEAFMVGIPVISTKINGIPEHVHAWNGILVEKGNEQELNTAITQFLDNNFVYDAKKLHKYAVDNFGYQAVGSAFNSVYHKILND